MIKTEIINYGDSETEFCDTICYDDAVSGAKPGVLVTPTFKRHTNFEIGKAQKLARLGLTGFAADIYGAGVRPESPDEARELMNNLNADRAELLRRIEEVFD